MRCNRSNFGRLAALVLLACASESLLAMSAKPIQAIPDPANPSPEAGVLSGTAAPLQSPLPDAVISSEFGQRRHPLLKRVRFHGGLDFAASKGTPVLAAGAGIVEMIGRAREHGLYVVIRHSQRLLSGYAHLSKLRAGLWVGQRVGAQQVIGAVGHSGRAAGSHLHFEVLVDQQRVDPRSALSLPPLAAAASQHPLPAFRFALRPTVADGMG